MNITKNVNASDAGNHHVFIRSYRDNSPADQELQALFDSINGEQKVDYATPFNRVELHQREAEEGTEFRVRFGDFDMPFNEHFRKQMSDRLAPGLGTYSRHLLEQGKGDLVLENHNRLLKDSDRKAQVRSLSNGLPQHARAFVSDAFKAIDDDVVFGTALPIIGQHGDTFRCIGGRRTDLKTYAKVVTREPILTIQSGEREREFFAGFMMSNSEVGQGMTAFHAFIMDGYCLNGCIIGKQSIVDIKWQHRGARISTDFGPIMENRIERAKQEQMTALIEDAAHSVCDASRYGPIVEILERANENTITEDPVPVIEVVAEKVGLTKKEVEVLPLHMNLDEPTQLGVQAAITSLAQKAPSYERRVALEQAGGRVLDLTDKQWSAVTALV